MVNRSPIIISVLLESQQMCRTAQTLQRCTDICNTILKTTAQVLRQNVIKKSQVSFFFFLPLGFIRFLNEQKTFFLKKSHTSPILLIRKQFVNSVFWIKSP